MQSWVLWTISLSALIPWIVFGIHNTRCWKIRWTRITSTSRGAVSTCNLKKRKNKWCVTYFVFQFFFIYKLLNFWATLNTYVNCSIILTHCGFFFFFFLDLLLYLSFVLLRQKDGVILIFCLSHFCPRNYHNKDTVIPEDSRKCVTEY